MLPRKHHFMQKYFYIHFLRKLKEKVLARFPIVDIEKVF